MQHLLSIFLASAFKLMGTILFIFVGLNCGQGHAASGIGDLVADDAVTGGQDVATEPPHTYTAFERLQGTWDLKKIECVDGSAPETFEKNEAGDSLTFTLTPSVVTLQAYIRKNATAKRCIVTFEGDTPEVSETKLTLHHGKITSSRGDCGNVKRDLGTMSGQYTLRDSDTEVVFYHAGGCPNGSDERQIFQRDTAI